MKKLLTSIALLGGLFFLTSINASAHEINIGSIPHTFVEYEEPQIILTGNTRVDARTRLAQREAIVYNTGIQIRSERTAPWQHPIPQTRRTIWFTHSLTFRGFSHGPLADTGLTRPTTWLWNIN
jgi:hypothetical protein